MELMRHLAYGGITTELRVPHKMLDYIQEKGREREKVHQVPTVSIGYSSATTGRIHFKFGTCMH